MATFKTIFINWQINAIQQKIKSCQKKGKDVKAFRSEIAELNRRKNLIKFDINLIAAKDISVY